MKTTTSVRTVVMTLAVLTVGFGVVYASVTGVREKTHNPPPANAPHRLRAEKHIKLVAEAIQVWKEDGDRVQAEKLLHEAITLCGDSDSTSAAMAELLDEQGREKEALVYYKKLIYDPLVATEKTSQRVFRYAELCEKFGQPAEATRMYTHVVELITWNAFGTPILLRGQTLQQARTSADVVGKMVSKDPDKIEAILAKHPDVEIGYLFLAESLTRFAKKEEARAALQKAEQASQAEVRQASDSVRQQLKL